MAVEKPYFNSNVTTIDVYKRFSKNLSDIRNNRGMTQANVARSLHITRQAYCNYENCKRLPDLAMIYSLSRVFNVSIDRFFDDRSAKTVSGH